MADRRTSRRRFLRLLAGTTAGGALGSASAGVPVQDAARPDVPKGAVPSRAIKIGMTAAFTGTAAALGTELYRGAQAYYDEINDQGGIHGRPILVAVFDDRYEPLPCVMNTLRLLEE